MNTDTLEKTIASGNLYTPLLLSERCDKCSAAAMVRVVIANPVAKSAPLLFCGHHAYDYRTDFNKGVEDNSMYVYDPANALNKYRS
jgi:hypothetical protein